ncbi:hypothetical protein [Dyadobacter sp. Leaf189]|uniref:hypothetical protein n=1 Tax=Dyadobacter sp. Leaf189 TaxID=1736295 RepID=UPI0006FAD85E|nr:hypothetical protein [Dyadobacter sp. Leaf189]KQS32978.1 hypothetical protein ASG33_02500 [Dyadobacter sp. Leaf189]
MNSTLVNGYIGLLDSLSLEEKLDLISKLSASAKQNIVDKKSAFRNAFGAFDSKKTADEIIDEIKSSRVATREIESF